VELVTQFLRVMTPITHLNLELEVTQDMISVLELEKAQIIHLNLELVVAADTISVMVAVKVLRQFIIITQ
jgi:hypothetical protein